MKKHKIFLIAPAVALTVIAIFIGIFGAAGWTADVVNDLSLKSFKAVYEYAGYSVAPDIYAVQSPDGEASFIYRNQTVEMQIELAPFVSAGLDVSSLPPEYAVSNGVLTLETAYSRAVLGYHSAMGHFNISFGNGNAFEWAQDIKTNDKDIVFSLNPEPFISAGVDVGNISGWTYGEVEMHENGKTVNEFRLLKAIDLTYSI